MNLGLSDLPKLRQNTDFYWAALVTIFQRCPGQGHSRQGKLRAIYIRGMRSMLTYRVENGKL